MEGKQKKEEKKKMKCKIRNYNEFIIFYWVVVGVLTAAAVVGVWWLS